MSVATTTATAAAPSAITPATGGPSPAAAAGAGGPAATGADPAGVGAAAEDGAGAGTSAAEDTSRPTPPSDGGTVKPQSSSTAAWSAARSGTFSVPMTLTTSRRPSRSAAVTKVCRAASVNPVLPPSPPG
jgi:hypothetical protein